MLMTNHANPRICALHTKSAGNLLALRLTPAGTVSGDLVQAFLPHMAGMLEGVRNVGYASSPDWDELEKLQPDLLLHAAGSTTPELLYRMQQIAPAFVMDLSAGTWREHLRELAIRLDRVHEAELFIDHYETTCLGLRSAIGERFGPKPVAAALRFVGQEIRLMGIGRPLGEILFQELNFQPAEMAQGITKPYRVIAPHELSGLADADAIFVMLVDRDDARQAFAGTAGLAGWKSLKAVSGRQVYHLHPSSWLDYSAIGQLKSLEDASLLFSH